ncbi:hypothetical protein RB2501_01430 [Robiginitalea biformata HTCC2501]|uniref:PD-(D/E)XK endonuclease-like domain-containing protein n=1 Tax=Robiginitalea biformata (strain ATCC BAA-864 / DSM 15991 / KCTC 12146 / HTCC2501) TaxID=313596 RepID=A4CPW1_ROBBH|nr:hypothetical protein RB2501_01430 [Robiginitalea biformata HTCC2501]
MNRIDVLDERFYQVGDEYYPSVTTVLSAYPKGYGFQEWLKNVGGEAERILREAADRGSNVHNAIEQILLGRELQWITEGKQHYSLDEWQMICRFMEFYQDYIQSGEQVATETQLFSKKMKLGGTCDMVAKINGETWMIDFKTSNGLYKTHEIQLAAYKEMWDEHNSPKIDRYGILWLNSNHRTKRQFQGVDWQLKEFTDSHEYNLQLYYHTRALWDCENPNYAPKNLSYPNTISIQPQEQLAEV